MPASKLTSKDACYESRKTQTVCQVLPSNRALRVTNRLPESRLPPELFHEACARTGRRRENAESILEAGKDGEQSVREGAIKRWAVFHRPPPTPPATEP